MIEGFRHRALKRFYEKGDCSGLRADMVEKIENNLTILDVEPAPKASIFRVCASTGSRAI